MFNFREALFSYGNDKEKVLALLDKFDLTLDKDLDYTLVVEDGDKIIGTGSYSSNVLKCLAVDPEYQSFGLSNQIVSRLLQKLNENNIFHIFIFTKPIYEKQMLSFGFSKIAQVEDKLILLDNKKENIDKFCSEIKAEISKKFPNLDSKKTKISAIVMNANPFTYGHKFLAEYAAKNSDLVVVFVVRENKSQFSFDLRFEAVKKGLEDLENILVVDAGEYIISSSTFPTYFLKDQKIIDEVYAKLDATIFAKYIAKKLDITRRFVGEEPTDIVTKNYNDKLKEILIESNIELIEIPRKTFEAVEVVEGEAKIKNIVISASKFRSLLAKKKLSELSENENILLKKLLPVTSIEVLKKYNY